MKMILVLLVTVGICAVAGLLYVLLAGWAASNCFKQQDPDSKR